MSEEKNIRKPIKEFLKEVKEKLPEWLKSKKEDKEILNDLEAHIWDKADELSESGEATLESVRKAIASMGTPDSIAKEFKRRGTPKVYITEELWSYYLKTLMFVFLMIVAINVVYIIVNVLIGSIENLWGAFNIFNTLGGVFILVTIIYVFLSMEGYLPEDFKSKKQQQKDQKKLEKAKEKGQPISPKTGKPLKPIVKPGEKIAGGIFGLIFGFLFILQPIAGINKFFESDFLVILRIAGIFIILDAFITLARGALGNQNVIGQQITLVAMACLKFASIFLFAMILSNLDIFPIIYVEDDVVRSMTFPKEHLEAFANLWILIIVIQVISGIYDIYKAGTLVKYKVK